MLKLRPYKSCDAEIIAKWVQDKNVFTIWGGERFGDYPINAEIIVMILSKKKIEAEIAENGRIAVEMFEDHDPGYYDAILMDMRMPEMDGLSATKAIRALDREDAGSIPIIALTANAFDEDVERSLKAGLNAHLSKPVNSDVLLRTLEQMILGSQSFK